MTAKEAPGSERYDWMYENDDETYNNPRTSQYYKMYQKTLAMVLESGVKSVLEVGCGSGTFSQMMVKAGLSYTGFDFSPVGVRKAQARDPRTEYFVGDATDPACYARPFDAIVCCEVLEHLADDLAAVERWPSGAAVFCSVPNFDDATHVRLFRSETEVLDRYGGLMQISHIERIAKSARANLGLSAYFRRLRWARDNPKRVLGMLGINAFDWYAGWFVFAGRRR